MSHIYFYQLLQPDGRLRFGLESIPLERASSVRAWLEQRYAHCVVVALVHLPHWLSSLGRACLRLVRGAIRPADLAGLVRDLAVMTHSGIPIVDAVRARLEDGADDSHRQVVRVCRQLHEDLRSGNALSYAIARQSEVFPPTVRSLVKIGEESGTVSEMLMEASDHLERVLALKADARQALIYPAISLVAVLGAGVFWLVYVLPNLVQLFRQLNARLPPFTMLVLSLADWLNRHSLALGVVIAGSLLAAVLAWRLSLAIRRLVFRMLHRVPVVRSILVASGMAFFAEYFGILVRSGVDIVASLKIMAEAQPDLYYGERIHATRLAVEKGARVSAAMRQAGGFPSLLVRMISVGEDSGTLDAQLTHVAHEYAVRLRRLIGTLAEVIKPLMILFVGAILLGIIIAFLLPVYDLIGQTMAAHR